MQHVSLDLVRSLSSDFELTQHCHKHAPCVGDVQLISSLHRVRVRVRVRTLHTYKYMYIHTK